MKRKVLTLSDKIALLDQIRREAPDASQRKLEKLMGISRSTIGCILRNEQKLRYEWELQQNQGPPRKRKHNDEEVDEGLCVAEVTSHDETALGLSGSMLKSKAKDLAEELEHPEFKSTDAWLFRWESKCAIKLEKVQSDVERAENCLQLPEVLKQFSADDIYNADETALLYRATPDGTLCYNNKALVGCKEAKDRLTVLCCCNMSGSDKKKLLVVGKQIKPVYFNGLRMDALPVQYKTDESALMTSEIFSEWLREWDVQLQHQSRKILLLLYTSAAHRYTDSLKNIILLFLPNSILQPMDIGITQTLKTLYRVRLVCCILDAIADNHLQSSSTATDISKRINIFKAIHFLADSWRGVKESTIRNCFALCSLENPEHWEVPVLSTEEESSILMVENYKEFLAVDKNLRCTKENDYCDEMDERTKENEDGDDVYQEIKPISHRDARRFIEGLRIYFMQLGNEGCPMSSLDVCADFVHRQLKQYSKQRILDVYF